MLAYRHLFHAGNFADVFKHALLTRLLLLLARKDKPFRYVDTHAGLGSYDLSHAWARKLSEHQDGITRVWGRKDVPKLFAPYLDAVRAENPDGNLRYYPGSPQIARRLLRPDDRLLLSELNPDDCKVLAKRFERDRRAVVHCLDGYQTLKAHLPPTERRGLILIDSSFDRGGEFARLTRGVVEGYGRFATGVYVLWYPLMEPAAMHGFERGLAATGIRKMLQLELSVMPDSWSVSLRGCGLIVVNPPYGFEQEARPMLDWLEPILSQAEEGTARRRAGGSVRVRWLVPE